MWKQMLQVKRTVETTIATVMGESGASVMAMHVK